MKCWNCHHLNNASDADCFMCGAVLYSGSPKVHGSLYVFLALCVLLPVFAVAGGTSKVVELFGGPVARPGSAGQSIVVVKVGRIPVAASRVKSNGPIFMPIVLGVLGVGACLYVTRTPFALNTQLILSGLVVLTCWAAYIGLSVGLAKENAAAHHAMTDPGVSLRT